MQAVVRIIPVADIEDWPTFHDVFQRTLGFPDYYGRNMDAWIDCMTYLDDREAGMTTVSVDPGGVLIMQLENATNFERRCPEQYRALLELPLL